jgi:UDP-N-acetylmuramoyl-L-alanyl-D-glutamate--2,6-diaminopimelate ligase
VNADDPSASAIVAGTRAQTKTYAIDAQADFRAMNMKMNVAGTAFTIKEQNESVDISTPLIGRFNVSNVLAAYAAGRVLGFAPSTVIGGIASVRNVRGRFERIVAPAGWTAIVDYAHTPDALDNCLKTIRDLMSAQSRGRVITVFGAGGDRDRSKRPLMGTVVARYSDVVIVTSDNPRTEDPEGIIDDIVKGIGPHPACVREADRRTAIRHALAKAQPGDVVLVAGKGHEEYQVVGRERMPFSDRAIIEENIR